MRSRLRLKTKLASEHQTPEGDGHNHTRSDSSAQSERMIARLDDALRNLGDRSALNRSALAHSAYLERLANEKYRDKIMPRGLALREVIAECVNKISAEVGSEPGLEKACRYLDLRAKGVKCCDISSELGLAREHVSRTVRKRALELLSEEFLSMTRKKD